MKGNHWEVRVKDNRFVKVLVDGTEIAAVKGISFSADVDNVPMITFTVYPKDLVLSGEIVVSTKEETQP